MATSCIGCTAAVGGVVNDDMIIICVYTDVFAVYITKNYIHELEAKPQKHCFLYIDHYKYT